MKKTCIILCLLLSALVPGPSSAGGSFIPSQVSDLLDDLGAMPGLNQTSIGKTATALNAGASISVMHLVALNSSSQWVKADAVSVYAGILGIALESKSSGPIKVALPHSIIRNDTWTWTPGATLYISTSSGGITAVQPNGADQAVRVIGFALDATDIYFNPSQDYITHQ